jgi:hypothetical protein
MSLPRFLDRIIDATTPVLEGIDREAVRTKLKGTSITLTTTERAATASGTAGFLFAANLLARLYPRIVLQGPDDLTHRAKGEIVLVNPRADVVVGRGETTATLAYEALAGHQNSVSVLARSWNVYVDPTDDPGEDEVGGPAALAASALGVSEVFRIVFADELGERGRQAPQPSAFNLVTPGTRSRARGVRAHRCRSDRSGRRTRTRNLGGAWHDDRCRP